MRSCSLRERLLSGAAFIGWCVCPVRCTNLAACQAQEYLDTGKLSDLLKKYSHLTALERGPVLEHQPLSERAPSQNGLCFPG